MQKSKILDKYLYWRVGSHQCCLRLSSNSNCSGNFAVNRSLADLAELRALPKKLTITAKTNEGFAYLAVVIDLYSRKVVGWAMQSRQTTDLVL